MANKACHVFGSATQVGLTQVLGLMSKTLALLVLTTLAIGCHKASPSTSAEIVASELTHASGRSAKMCGLIRLGEDPSSAMSCAQTAVKSSQPFWVAIEHPGIDSSIWDGALLSTGGLHQVFHYDSNPYGRKELLPKLTRESCHTLIFTDNRDEPFACGFRDEP